MNPLWKARLIFALSVLFLLTLEFARAPSVVQLERTVSGGPIQSASVSHGEPRPSALASADTAQSHATPAPNPESED